MLRGVVAHQLGRDQGQAADHPESDRFLHVQGGVRPAPWGTVAIASAVPFPNVCQDEEARQSVHMEGLCVWGWGVGVGVAARDKIRFVLVSWVSGLAPCPSPEARGRPRPPRLAVRAVEATARAVSAGRCDAGTCGDLRGVVMMMMMLMVMWGERCSRCPFLDLLHACRNSERDGQVPSHHRLSSFTPRCCCQCWAAMARNLTSDSKPSCGARGGIRPALPASAGSWATRCSGTTCSGTCSLSWTRSRPHPSRDACRPLPRDALRARWNRL